MKQTVTVPQLTMSYRDDRMVDVVIGKKRKSVKDCEPLDFSQCPLAKAYPNYDDFLEEIHKQRTTQKAGGPLAHPRAIRPAQAVQTVKVKAEAPWEDGPSMADVKFAYKTTDRGR